MSDNPQKRYQAITKIIAEETVPDQITLVNLLKRRFGIATTQVQISRDLRKLGICKKNIGSHMTYELPEVDHVREILRLAIVSVSHNETTIIVKTVPGFAPYIAYLLDGGKLDLLGTVAGEDTVFAAPASIKKIRDTYAQVCSSLYYKKRGKK